MFFVVFLEFVLRYHYAQITFTMHSHLILAQHMTLLLILLFNIIHLLPASPCDSLKKKMILIFCKSNLAILYFRRVLLVAYNIKGFTAIWPIPAVFLHSLASVKFNPSMQYRQIRIRFCNSTPSKMMLAMGAANRLIVVWKAF